MVNVVVISDVKGKVARSQLRLVRPVGITTGKPFSMSPPDECRNVRSSKRNEGRISPCRMVDLDANPQTERIRSD
jgi:hypothetical protein